MSYASEYLHDMTTNELISSYSCVVCLLRNDRICPEKFKVGNRFDTDPDFINAVIKVQQHREQDLTVAEADTIERWKIVEEVETLEEPCNMFQQRIRERERKLKQATQQFKSAYNPAIMHCVVGSAAEAERVWSMAGHVLTEHRASLSPLVFELIMYLKYNARLWDLSDVVSANKARKNDTPAKKKRLEAHLERLNKMRAEVADWNRQINDEEMNKAQNEEEGDK